MQRWIGWAAAGLAALIVIGCGQGISTIETSATSPIPDASQTISAADRETARADAIATVRTHATETALIPTITPIPPTSTATFTPNVPLSAKGPWLVFTADLPDDAIIFNTLWAINSDGTGLTQLTTDYVWLFAINSQPDANGEIEIAYITSPTAMPTNLDLHTISLPSRNIRSITPLTSPATTLTDQDPNTPDSGYWELHDIAVSITYDESLAWSPDGKWLAFVGAIDGNTADVYCYELSTGIVRHLTTGAANAFQLLWTPDSHYIVHTSQYGAFGLSGGLYRKVHNVWAAAPDGSSVIELDSGPADFLGWADPDTLVLYSGEDYGYSDALRTINLRTGSIIDLEPKCFTSLAYSPEGNTFLIFVSSYEITACKMESNWKEGLYVISGTHVVEVKSPLTPSAILPLKWSPEAGMFLGHTEWAAFKGITLSGEVVSSSPYPIPSQDTAVSNDGSLWAWVDYAGWYIASAPNFEAHRVIQNGVLETWSELKWTP